MRLERSKDLPIDIYIECEHQEPTKPDATDGGTPFDVDRKFLYSLLIPHIHRWRTIEVSVSEYRHMQVFLSTAADPSISAAPRLTTLRLELYHKRMEESNNSRYPSISKHFILFGGSAPSLTSVVLYRVHVDWSQPWIASASNLTYLELAFHAEDVRPSWAQFATNLRGASALERLSLRLSGPSGDPPVWFIEPTPGGPIDLNAPIQLPKVTDFIFVQHSPTRSIGLLRKFCLPALQNLVLELDDGDYTEFVRELAGPATSLSLPFTQEQPRSLLTSLERLQISELTITQFPFLTQSVLLLYDELRNLTSLNISLTNLSPLFLHILTTPSERSGILLSRLVTLYVSGTSGKVFRTVVRKRRDAGVPLNSLYVPVEEYADLEK
ncbi:hypothetical protein J3R82DRAFT_10067 [Butyriboletus roseoflavus]|nr:hypothetical protein J3R82DRAFT_10067 [Butyriboletus roseoflavus]